MMEKVGEGLDFENLFFKGSFNQLTLIKELDMFILFYFLTTWNLIVLLPRMGKPWIYDS